MIVKNSHTGKDYAITPETWAKLKANGKAEYYTIIEAETPKELKNVRAAAKAVKPLESENTHGITNIDDRLPGENPGDDE